MDNIDHLANFKKLNPYPPSVCEHIFKGAFFRNIRGIVDNYIRHNTNLQGFEKELGDIYLNYINVEHLYNWLINTQRIGVIEHEGWIYVYEPLDKNLLTNLNRDPLAYDLYLQCCNRDDISPNFENFSRAYFGSYPTKAEIGQAYYNSQDYFNLAVAQALNYEKFAEALEEGGVLRIRYSAVNHIYTAFWQDEL